MTPQVSTDLPAVDASIHFATNTALDLPTTNDPPTAVATDIHGTGAGDVLAATGNHSDQNGDITQHQGLDDPTEEMNHD